MKVVLLPTMDVFDSKFVLMILSLLFLSFNNIHPQMISFTHLPFKHRYSEGACDHFMVENWK